MRYLLATLIVTILSISSLFGQPARIDTVLFIDYYEVLDDLTEKGKDSEFYTSLDYESMLYLDRASFDTFKTLEPDFEEKHYIDTSSIFITVARQYVSEFLAEFNSIRAFLHSRSNWVHLVGQLDTHFKGGADAGNPVYVKDSTAICKFSVQGFRAVYRIQLQAEAVRFELLYQMLRD